ncbi:flagellar M-ring protein FliF [Sphingopyxis sp. H038]|uniref:flagellar basal-body MS-ring/collar protein FliF n=1 Tax=unclassified Sphingopyxis TaxID=2614943 RepID=UPI000731B4AC|nr:MULTISPECIES: flagellar basal-body MS-ring/collar protein FliF [unclassified Sphingopyxis]KTE00163.1 flagellar M-ring protein FliF [Sphingopyxis sp. H012]KTE07747.1 flagellar M-ring protein FliF [Sphingopyxis sp. H053]KTE11566.1 flagellar M-ring protein FliF [Sphingopyxis sp. H093]KTE27511.1 flagellar M-ring protein FliF [Sphingopyxis sp. H080]KTE33861.1 flagellar M-ring protein FliF [Sphingopyxis sp. H038]
MAETQILTPVPNSVNDGNANRLPAPVLGGRFAPFTQFMRQPAVQRALPAIAMTSAIGIAALAYFTMQAAPQAQLFAGLDDTDKAAVADALQTQGIGHSIDPTTGALTVDADKLHQARIALAGQGLPKAAPSGDSLIAALPMGSSRAIEGEALRSAREADLSRTIETIDAVKSARVHVAAAEPSLFVREDKPATASVMLTLQNGRSLSDGQVQAIRFLVASSIPGMNADQVSVIDQRGALLSDTASGSDMKAFQLQLQVEDRFRRALDTLLGPMLGAGNYSVEVHADVDMSESQATRESFPENDRALTSEQITRSTSGTSAPAVGIPGALSNQPPQATTVTATGPQPVPPGAPAPGTESNENAARAYEVGREISVTHSPQGKLRRVSVAVALNQGKKALTQADLTKIDNLVKGAIGYDATRGDLVAINQRPFVQVEDTAPAFYDQGWFMPLVKQVGAILAALLAFLFIGRPMIRAAKERAAKRIAQNQELEASLLAATDRPALASGQGGREITLEMIEQAPSYEARANLVRAFVRQDSARAALVVRHLMQEGARA